MILSPLPSLYSTFSHYLLYVGIKKKFAVQHLMHSHISTYIPPQTLEVVADSMNLDYGNSSDFNNDVFASIQKTVTYMYMH